jgi:hypothetical protein
MQAELATPQENDNADRVYSIPTYLAIPALLLLSALDEVQVGFLVMLCLAAGLADVGIKAAQVALTGSYGNKRTTYPLFFGLFLAICSGGISGASRSVSELAYWELWMAALFAVPAMLAYTTFQESLFLAYLREEGTAEQGRSPNWRVNAGEMAALFLLFLLPPCLFWLREVGSLPLYQVSLLVLVAGGGGFIAQIAYSYRFRGELSPADLWWPSAATAFSIICLAAFGARRLGSIPVWQLAVAAAISAAISLAASYLASYLACDSWGDPRMCLIGPL